MKYEFKEVGELPQGQRKIGMHEELLRQFLASNVKVADISEYLAKNKHTNVPLVQSLKNWINKLTFQNEVKISVRNNRAYLIRLEKEVSQ